MQNDTARVQSAIDNRTTLPPGTYICAGLSYPSHCRLIWPGVTIQAHLSLPPDRSLLWNGSFGSNSDCVISGITFDGSGQSKTAPLVYAIGVLDFTLSACVIKNTRYIGVGIANGDRNKVLGCYLTRTGNPVEGVEGGAAIWVGATGGHQTTNTEIMNNLCEDTEWSFLYLAGSSASESVVDPIVAGNVVRRIGESAIFVSNFCTRPIIRSNIIDSVHTKHISASGIELGASDTLIEGNVITNCGNGCIDTMDVNNLVCRNNICGNPGMEISRFPTAAAIQCITMPGSPSSGDLRIERNWMWSDGEAKTPALAFARMEGAPTIHRVYATLNNAAGSLWKPSALFSTEGILSPSCVIVDNVGF